MRFYFLKIVRDIVYFSFYDKKKVKKYDMIFTEDIVCIDNDIIPFFMRRQIDKESIFFLILFLALISLVMNIWK